MSTKEVLLVTGLEQAFINSDGEQCHTVHITTAEAAVMTAICHLAIDEWPESFCDPLASLKKRFAA